jgi:hypothetical protein
MDGDLTSIYGDQRAMFGSACGVPESSSHAYLLVQPKPKLFIKFCAHKTLPNEAGSSTKIDWALA